MTLKGNYALCFNFKTHASFGAHHENLNEDRPILSETMMYVAQWLWQYKVYVDIRGGCLERGVKSNNGVIESFDFSLRLRHLRKWGQHYLVPCRISTDLKMHDLEWRWMAILRQNFHYHEQPFGRPTFHYREQPILTVECDGPESLCRAELAYIMWPAKIAGSGPWSAEYLGSAGLRIFRRRYIVGTLANKANICI